ncbi:MAG: hypothetical protein ACKVS8_00440 [Phycisphaerales bacterium]
MKHLRTRLTLATLAALALCVAACAPKPAAEVSRTDLAAVKQSNASIKPGDPRQKVLDSFKKANTVKLGTSVIDGATIEEWKVEAFHDEDKRKDLFITFLYFSNDRFVDSSDTRIDFRNNPAIVARWQGAAAPR